MKLALPLAAFAMALFSAVVASPQTRSRAPLPRPPVLIAGIGLGPAFPECDYCDSKIGLGGRLFLTMPIALPFGVGFSADHEEFRLGRLGKSGFTFEGVDLILSTGFGLTWQVEVLLALGEGRSDSADPNRGGSGAAGELGARISRRIGGRARLGLTATVSIMETSITTCDSAECGSPPNPDFVSGARLITVDLAFELGPMAPAN